MKKSEIKRELGFIDPKFITEAAFYKPPRFNITKIASLAACIAILVTSVLTMFIWDTEEPADHNHSTPGNAPQGITDNTKGYGSIQLSNGTLDLNMIQLSNGKINADANALDKFVYKYDEIDEKTAFLEMITKALPYHNLTEIDADFDYTNLLINNTEYRLSVYDDLVTKTVKANGHYSDAKDIVNAYMDKHGYTPGELKFPEKRTEEAIFETFKDQIDLYNKIFVNNIDRCFMLPERPDFPPLDTRGNVVFFWDSSYTPTNKAMTELIEKYQGKGYNDWAYEDIQRLYYNLPVLRTNFLTTDGYVKKISITDNFPYVYHIDHNSLGNEIFEHLALELDKKYTCGSSKEDFFNCGMELEQYLTDVFGIAGLTNSYTVDILDIGESDFAYEQGFGLANQAILEIKITPTKDHENDVVRFSFYSMDSKTFFLQKISTEYCLGGDKYLELISPEKAIERLAQCKGIGDAGQGCYFCREKYYKEVVEYIQNNMTYELVMLPGLVFETESGEVSYEMPFYKFISAPDENGNYYVSYVFAADNSHNIKFSLYELNNLIHKQNLLQCPNAKNHSKVKKEKSNRTKELIDAYVAMFPEEEKGRATMRAEVLYTW